MKIEIQESGAEGIKTFRFPLCLIPCRLVGRMLANQEDRTILKGSEEAVSSFLKVLKHFAKENPGWVLVECEDEEGEKVKITL